MLQSWNKPITALYYSQKQITNGVKFPFQKFAGSDHILLKRCYPTIFIWYAKLALIRRKFFIEWGYDNSHPANRHQTYQSHHENGNRTRKLSLNTNNDLYARAWDCEYDEPKFDSDYNNLATPTSPEITIRSDQPADEIRSTPGTIPGNSPEVIPQPDRSYDGLDMDHDTQSDADTSVEQLDPTPTNPRSSKYDVRYNPKPNYDDDYRYWLWLMVYRYWLWFMNKKTFI